MEFSQVTKDKFANAFEKTKMDDGKKEWWEAFETPIEAIDFLDRLVDCSDTVPIALREDIADWVEAQSDLFEDEEVVQGIINGCTYGKAANIVRELLLARLESANE